MSETITHDPPPAPGGRQSGPLIVTEDTELLDDLLRLCAAAGATPEVRHSVPGAAGYRAGAAGAAVGPSAAYPQRGGWDAAPLVLVGDDAARRIRGGEWSWWAATRTIRASGNALSRSAPTTC